MFRCGTFIRDGDMMNGKCTIDRREKTTMTQLKKRERRNFVVLEFALSSSRLESGKGKKGKKEKTPRVGDFQGRP